MSANSDGLLSPSTPSRFVVGIDLGTTNSAVCFVDTHGNDSRVQTFRIPQLISPGEIESLESLPSFHYHAAKGEFADRSLSMPWSEAAPETAVGVFAREQGKLVPGRVIESAKSWLSHVGVDRTSGLLPWHGSADVPRLSPVEASAAYLFHIKCAWNHAHPQHPLEQQDLVITLPASFDEVARELTVAAAKLAGLQKIVLIEEPQAAFYAWISAHPDSWNTLVSPGQNILVCDVGGGTSDFTLIRVRAGSNDQVQFHRVAVGDHLILGGDNLDLALAHHLERKLMGEKKLEPRQWGSLVRICRHVKETLLSENAPESYSVSLPGSGSKLIGGGLRVEISRDEARNLLMEGFFPHVQIDDHPQRKLSGFQEFGLPYAADPAATRHLAKFLQTHSRAGLKLGEEGSTRPDVLLFNGGAFISPLIQQRMIDVITDWFANGDPNWAPLVLHNARHDLAVAQGAAYYGMVRRGTGVRISAGLPRTYYMGVETIASGAVEGRVQALCLMPAGAEPGTEVDLREHPFQLTISSPVEFPLFHSSSRLTDRPGSISPIEREQLTALPPIRTVLRSRKEKEATSIAVELHARLTEIGTLQVWCTEVDGNRSWQLQFDIRSATHTDVEAHRGTGEAAGVLDEHSIQLVQSTLQNCFGPNSNEKPAGLPKRISKLLELSREEWPPALLRQIWEMLLELESGRKLSAEHEARWLNLFGFALRPGEGMALDDWRVAESWRRLRSHMHYPGPATLSEWWILWRRVAAGLAAGQQQSLATPLLTRLKDEQRKERQTNSVKKGGHPQEQIEAWRMLASMERLPVTMKQQLAEIAIEHLYTPERAIQHPAILWSIGRLGARQPFYGPLNTVVAPEVAAEWLDRLLAIRQPSPERFFAVMQLARRTDDRYRDLPADKRQKAVNFLTSLEASEEFIALVETGGELQAQTSALVFGESLPIGLKFGHS
ncbi:Hsp70 family protein [Planctomicrobium sp. SH668]|uniref:hsp70 family protein n=1 Tax=Planctomicrobium sp. SH668 TaxID=3448126 RepID=UPI003F5CB3A3